MLAHKMDQKYNYGDYLTWNDDTRWELINGVPYNMSPAPNQLHQEISGNLFAAFHSYLIGKGCKVFHAPFDVKFPKGNEKEASIETVVQPDIVIVCDKSKLDGKGCNGAPDLTVEILSPSTAKHDMKQKLVLYEQSGVKEYWIIDPDHKIVMVFKLGIDNHYGRPEIYAEDDQIAVGIVEDLTVELSKIFPE